MNTKYRLLLSLLAVAGTCTAARASLFSDSFDTTVVAERGMNAPAQPDGTIAAALVDGGYIEAGDPIAGEDPPSAASVRQEMQDALGQQSFRVGAASPAVVISYYWGVIRIDHSAVRLPFGINANQDARIKLVSTTETGAEVENHLLARKGGGGQSLDASSPAILVGPLDTIVQNARKPRYFVVISAYQNNGSENQRPTLLWRVKASAQETSGGMDEVIPALIAKAATYFGKNIQYPQIVQATLMKSVNPSPSTENTNGQTGMASDAATSPAMGALVKQERTEISGTGDGKS